MLGFGGCRWDRFTIIEMFDITQTTTPASVTFSANSGAAHVWMRHEHGHTEIYFNVPSRQADVAAFIAGAEANDLSVGPPEAG
jgi:hypothetical protein